MRLADSLLLQIVSNNRESVMTLSFSPVKNNNASQEVSGVLSPYHSSSAADTRDEHPNLLYDEFTDIDDDIFSMLSSAYCDVSSPTAKLSHN